MTTTTAPMPSVGATVTRGRLPRNATGPGRVTHAGPCGWPRCHHGDACVTVRWPGISTTTNHHVDELEEIPTNVLTGVA